MMLKGWVSSWICFQLYTYKNVSGDNVLLRCQEPSRKVLDVKAALLLEILWNYILKDLYCSSSLVSMRPVGTLLLTVIVLKLLWIVLRDHQVSSYNSFTQYEKLHRAKLLVQINVTLVKALFWDWLVDHFRNNCLTSLMGRGHGWKGDS